MKCFVFVFTVITLLANTVAVSAWAKPYVNMSAPSSVAETVEMICHEKQNEPKSPTTHCHGVCLCFHASIAQTPILGDNSALNVPLGHLERFFIENHRVQSMAIAPPQRPPKSDS